MQTRLYKKDLFYKAFLFLFRKEDTNELKRKIPKRYKNKMHFYG